jgi:hypothetical protein
MAAIFLDLHRLSMKENLTLEAGVTCFTSFDEINDFFLAARVGEIDKFRKSIALRSVFTVNVSLGSFSSLLIGILTLPESFAVERASQLAGGSVLCMTLLRKDSKAKCSESIKVRLRPCSEKSGCWDSLD